MRIVRRVLPLQEGIASKYLQATTDGFVVETTYIRRPDKHILCVSTQVGCAIGCRFCISGNREDRKYQRSLSVDEILSQCRNIVHEMDFAKHPQPLLFSFMGEGEPFLNFFACMEAFQRIAKEAWQVPVRFAISTSGPRPDLILQLARVEVLLPLKLQVSLHGPTDEIRRQIVPVTKPLNEIVSAVRDYREMCAARPDRPVEWNYVLCADINDSPECAESLVGLLGPGWHIKLNRLNNVPGVPFLNSSLEAVARFKRILEEGGLSTENYETDESRISSGCGQLSYGFEKPRQ